jgi:hypothetical protein
VERSSGGWKIEVEQKGEGMTETEMDEDNPCCCEECLGLMAEGVVYEPDAFAPPVPLIAAVREKIETALEQLASLEVVEDGGDD